MSANTEHLKSLMRAFDRVSRTAEDANDRDSQYLDLLTTMLETIEAERHQLVNRLRSRGLSWAGIAISLGTTRQAAQMRYGKTEAPDGLSPRGVQEAIPL